MGRSSCLCRLGYGTHDLRSAKFVQTGFVDKFAEHADRISMAGFIGADHTNETRPIYPTRQGIETTLQRIPFIVHKKVESASNR